MSTRETREPFEPKVIEGGKSLQPSVKRDDASSRTYSLDDEAAVISNVLIDPDAIAEVRGWLAPDAFYSEAHRRIFEAVCELADAGDAVNIVSVATRLRESGRLAQVGGMPYVTEVLNAAPVVAPAHLRKHARTVRDLHVRRQIKTLGLELQSRVDNDPADAIELVTNARAQIETFAATLAQSETSVRMEAVVGRVFEDLIKAAQSPGVSSRPTGFDRLDRITAGLPKDLCVLAAEPGMGKTALACAIAVNVAMAGGGVILFSLETTELPITTRIIAAEGRVDAKRAMLGDLTPAEWSRLTAAGKEIAGLPMWIPTDAALSVRDIWTKARITQLQLGREGRRLELVVVDYLQLVRPRSGAIKRNEQVAEVTRALKAMATELDCSVLALSQLNRAPSERDDHRPRLSDLAESSELAKCPRLILLLYRADHYAKDGDPHTGIAEIRVAKQNNGPKGLVRLHFDGPSTRFDNLADGEFDAP